jgi:hypothetical protein
MFSTYSISIGQIGVSFVHTGTFFIVTTIKILTFVQKISMKCKNVNKTKKFCQLVMIIRYGQLLRFHYYKFGREHSIH